jgi:hypothetical protein
MYLAIKSNTYGRKDTIVRLKRMDASRSSIAKESMHDSNNSTYSTDRQKAPSSKAKSERINTPNTTHPAIYSSLQSASNSKKRKNRVD